MARDPNFGESARHRAIRDLLDEHDRLAVKREMARARLARLDDKAERLRAALRELTLTSVPCRAPSWDR